MRFTIPSHLLGISDTYDPSPPPFKETLHPLIGQGHWPMAIPQQPSAKSYPPPISQAALFLCALLMTFISTIAFVQTSADN
jgi:hypothetical protein